MPELDTRRRAGWAGLVVLVGSLLGAGLSAHAGGESQGADATPPGLAIPLHEAIYHATVRRVPVRAGVRLEAQSDGLFVYRTWAEPRGVLGIIRRDMAETSLILVDGDGRIIPVSYRRRDGVGGRDSDMRFDRSQGKVHIEYRGEQTVTDWEPGIYDLLSLRLVLAHDLARGALQDIYRVVDDRSRIEKVDVEVAGRERLSTPLGELETIRLEYTSERRDRLYRLWIAPELDSVMVRLEQYEEGRLRGALNLVEYRRL